MTSAEQTKVTDFINQEIALMTALAELLQKESTALLDNEISALNQFTQEKSILVNQVNELEKQRAMQLSALGFANTLDGIALFLDHAGDEVQASWQQLLKITEQARENNRSNGLLINRRLQQSQAGLDALQQNNPAGNLYGPSGQSLTNSALKGRGVKAG